MPKKEIPHYRKNTPVTIEVVLDKRPRGMMWPDLEEQLEDLRCAVLDCEARAHKEGEPI